MSQALLALLPCLLIHSCALRPQEDAVQDARFVSNWGTPGTSWLELGEASRGNKNQTDSHVLTVGHSAILQHEAKTARLGSRMSLANAGFALAQFALSDSRREPHSNDVSSTGENKVANPNLHSDDSQVSGAHQREQENNHGSGERDVSSAEHVESSAHEGSDVKAAQEEKHATANHESNTVEASKLQQEKISGDLKSSARKQEVAALNLERDLDKTLADAPPLADSPLRDLVGERAEHAVIEDGGEMEQEMDDIIVDVGEIERLGGKVLRKISKFWDEEGIRHVCLNFAVYFAGVFICLGLYATCFRHRDVKAEQEFRYGVCECMSDGRVCICGLCCPAIRWSDTVSEQKGGFLDFSTGLLIMIGLGIVLLCPFAGVVAYIGIVVIGVYYRQKIRLRYGLEADTVQSYIEDVFVWSCCAWCAICQEARQVDEETEEVVIDPNDLKTLRSLSTSW